MPRIRIIGSLWVLAGLVACHRPHATHLPEVWVPRQHAAELEVELDAIRLWVPRREVDDSRLVEDDTTGEPVLVPRSCAPTLSSPTFRRCIEPRAAPTTASPAR